MPQHPHTHTHTHTTTTPTPTLVSQHNQGGAHGPHTGCFLAPSLFLPFPGGSWPAHPVYREISAMSRSSRSRAKQGEKPSRRLLDFRTEHRQTCHHPGWRHTRPRVQPRGGRVAVALDPAPPSPGSNPAPFPSKPTNLGGRRRRWEWEREGGGGCSLITEERGLVLVKLRRCLVPYLICAQRVSFCVLRASAHFEQRRHC